MLNELEYLCLMRVEAGKEKEILNVLKNMKFVSDVHILFGSHSFVVKVESESREKLLNVIIPTLREIEGVKEINAVERPEMLARDAEETLKKIVRDSGHVEPIYGGYQIIVRDSSTFPWESVFKLLLSLCFEVLVRKKDGNIEIISELYVE